MGILDQIEQITKAAPTDAAPGISPDGDFTRGLRSGMTSAGGQFDAFKGGVAEAIGNTDFAQEMYAKSAAAQQLAAEQAPSIRSYKNVTDLRSGLKYASGLVGQSLPITGMGLAAGAAGALTGGPVGAMAASTAAVAPLMTGEAIQTQQADPEVSLRHGAGMRLLNAGVAGVSSAALENVVGLGMAGKVVSAAKRGAMPLGKALLKNVPESMLGEGATEGAQQLIQQGAHTALNPNRDKSGDTDELLESSIGGAVAGAPMGAVGAVGDAKGKIGMPNLSGIVDGAKGLAGKVKDKVSKEPVDLKVDPNAPVDLASMLKPAAVTGDDHALDMGLPDMPEAQHEETFKQADTAASERATKLQQTLLGNKKVNDAERQFISGLDVNDADGQSKIDRLYDRYAQQDDHEKAMDAMVDVLAKFDADEGVMRSNDAATPKEFYGYFDKPEFDYMNEGTKKRAAESLSRIIELAENGKPIPAEVRRAFGDQLPAALKAAHGVTGNKDTGKREQFFKQLSSVMDEQKREGDLIAAVSESLPEHLIDRVKGPQVKAFVAQMKDYVLGNDAKDMGANEYKVHRREQEDKLQALFGDKYDQVNEAFATWAKENAGTKERNTVEDGEDLTERDPAEEMATPKFYGGGKDKANPKLVERADIHRNKFGSESAAERLEGQARAENQDRSVRWMDAKEYAQAHGIDDAKLAEMTDGRPDEFGIVVAEGKKDEDGIDWNELDEMQLGRRKDGKREFSADFDSPSRIDTEANGVILDAQRMAKVMNRKLPFAEGETSGSPHRLRRVFEAAIAAASDHLQEALHVGDDVVVAKRNGKEITYGELKKLGPDPQGTKSFDVPDDDINELEAEHTDAAESLERRKESLKRTRQTFATLSNKENQTATEANDLKEAKRLIPKYKKNMATLERYVAKLERRIERIKAQALAEDLDAGNIGDGKLETGIERNRGGEVVVTKSKVTGESRLSGDNVHTDAVLSNGKPAPVEFDEAGKPIQYATKGEQGPQAVADQIKENIDKLAGKANSAAGRAIVGRARALFDHFDNLSREHQKHFAQAMDKVELSVSTPGALDKSKLPEVINIINALAEKYADKLKTPSKNPVQKRESYAALIKSGEFTLDRVKKSTDAKALQAGLIPLLRQKNPDANTKAMINAINDRISDLLLQSREEDGMLDYIMQVENVMESKGPVGTGRMTQQDERALVNLMRSMLGNSVGFDFASLGHAGEYHASTATIRGLIRISVHALNPKSTAYHESLHAFFDLLHKDGLHEVTRVLERAAKSGPVMQVLRAKFAGNEAVLKQIENSYEERAAYMFQLYADRDTEMMAALSATPKTVFGQIKNAILNALGVWSNHQRAVHIMEYFQTGEYAKNMGNVDTVYADTMEKGTNKHIDFIKENAVPLQRLGTAFLVVGSERIRGYENPALTKIVDLTHRSKFDGGDDQGYIPARRIESFKRKDKMMQELDRLVPNAEAEDYNAALVAMRMLKKDPNALQALTPEQRLIARVFRQTLKETFSYMREAKVDIKDYGFGTDYAPRRWDIAEIASREAEFRAMIDKYVQAGSLTGDVEGMIQRMMGNEGGDIITDGSPKNPHAKERILKMISPEDAEPFMEKEALRTMSLYIDQATRRAEWARRFDSKDPQTMEMIPNGKYDAMLEEARTKYGATPEQIADTQKYIDGLNGMLGRDMSPTARKWIANTMIYQNLALLPLGIFSAVIDANGIMVNGGTVRDSFDAFIRGVKEIRKNFESKPKDDEAYKFAEEMGVIESVMLHHAMGGTTFGMLDASPWMRKANDFLFRYNGMEQWNTSMRVGAAQAALGFLRRHADGTADVHSKRYLAELGLKVGDIQMKPDGWPMMTKQDFVDAGLSDADATTKSVKMMFALNKWVDGAVLRPDATLKPIWMNDPRFKLFGHMKQFMFAFQETTLKRVAHEARFGNYTPIMALASYIPVMLAADVVKGLVQGAGDQPDWKDNWNGGDYFAAAVQRAGLFGVGQIGIDVLRSLKHGGYGVGALGGPTVSQLGDIALTATGDHSFQSTAIRALPANVLWGHWLDGANEG